MRLIREYGALCLDPYREGQINPLNRVQKNAAKFADHTGDLVWETLAQHGKIAPICALFKAYTGKWEWISIGGRLKRPCYRSKDDHDRKIRARQQRTDIGKYSLVNSAIKLWNQLPAEALANFLRKSHRFRNRFRKVMISDDK